MFRRGSTQIDCHVGLPEKTALLPKATLTDLMFGTFSAVNAIVTRFRDR